MTQIKGSDRHPDYQQLVEAVSIKTFHGKAEERKLV